MIKGSCIIFIVFGHWLQFWVNDPEYFLWFRKWAELFGPGIFLFIAGVNQSLSIEKRYSRGDSFREVVSYSFRSYLVLLLIGLVSNIVISFFFGGVNLSAIFEYRILFGIALSVLISWPFSLLRTQSIKRIIIGSVFLILGALGYAYELTTTIPHLFANGRLSPFPNAGFTIIGGVFGHHLFHTDLQLINDDKQNDGFTEIMSKQRSFRFLLTSLIVSLCLLSLAFTPGIGWIPDVENNGVDQIIMMNPFVWGTFDPDGFPFLANVHSIFFSSYIIGASILLISSLWKIFDVDSNNFSFKLLSILEFFGVYSFSFYVYHSLFIGLSFFGFQETLSPLLMFVVSAMILGVMGFWVNICVKYFNSVGTVEHFRKQLVGWLGDKIGL